ncbi:hypothetical protein HDU89_005875 [Geranomyces variabilis]|nr:hypothetical protein HDU89_005875 [Geranomyces variabilis]
MVFIKIYIDTLVDAEGARTAVVSVARDEGQYFAAGRVRNCNKQRELKGFVNACGDTWLELIEVLDSIIASVTVTD